MRGRKPTTRDETKADKMDVLGAVAQLSRVGSARQPTSSLTMSTRRPGVPPTFDRRVPLAFDACHWLCQCLSADTSTGGAGGTQPVIPRLTEPYARNSAPCASRQAATIWSRTASASWLVSVPSFDRRAMVNSRLFLPGAEPLRVAVGVAILEPFESSARRGGGPWPQPRPSGPTRRPPGSGRGSTAGYGGSGDVVRHQIRPLGTAAPSRTSATVVGPAKVEPLQAPRRESRPT